MSAGEIEDSLGQNNNHKYLDNNFAALQSRQKDLLQQDEKSALGNTVWILRQRVEMKKGFNQPIGAI